MRQTIVAALLTLAASAAIADYVATDGRNSVVLTNQACPAALAALVPPEWREIAQLADATIEGKHYAACYAGRSDGYVVLQYEDGDQGLIPISHLHKLQGV
jgi:hypothetical protein